MPEPPTPDCCLDTAHKAWFIGVEQGYAAGRQAASEDLAREWLHIEAVRWTKQATANAAVKGPAWTQAIREQAED